MYWATFVITFVVFAIALAGMAIGVIVSNRRIRGSCGGLANLRNSEGRPMCEGCTDPSPECRGTPEKATTSCSSHEAEG